jgi:hypothetical protein
MIANIPEGSIVLGDSYYCAIPDFVSLNRRGIDFVAKLHGRRDPQTLIREGIRIGRDEWLVRFETSEATRRNQAELDLPDFIWVRLIRCRYRHNGKRHTAWIATSLAQPDRYHKSEIVALYRSRWGIETHLNYLKTTLEMSVLRSQTPASIESELGAIILAHNLIFRLMHETAQTCKCSLDRLSFAAAIKTVLQTKHAGPFNPNRHRGLSWNAALKRLALRTNRFRPGRIEPRLVKRDKVRYGYLRTSRADARKAV